VGQYQLHYVARGRGSSVSVRSIVNITPDEKHMPKSSEGPPTLPMELELAGGCPSLNPWRVWPTPGKTKVSAPRCGSVAAGSLELNHCPGFRVLSVETALLRSAGTLDDPWRAAAYLFVPMPVSSRSSYASCSKRQAHF
jgi:hypothetical protein